MTSPRDALEFLESIRDDYGGDLAHRRLESIAILDESRLRSARDVARLHEILVFLRAYPDDARVLERVEAMLARFARRRDLRRFRHELADSGIAGTPIVFTFYRATARWLARRWPGRIAIDWGAFDDAPRLASMLHLLVPYSETPGLDEMPWSAREWIRAMKGPRETDASFLIRRFDSIGGDSFLRETLWDSLAVPLRLAPGPGTPSRTLARNASSPCVFRSTPLDRTRPSLRDALQRHPPRVRPVSEREGEALIDLAREAMVTRSRDLDAFANANPDDVRIVDWGDGLQFVCIGQIPERRLMFESVYGYLTLQSGVPVGYVLSASLFESAEIAYNVFETFRGGEAARVFGRVLATVRHLFGAEAFSIDSYQLGGQGNTEGLHSGAWWFYYKLGFRPVDPDVRRVLRAELAAMRRDARHRSPVATLRKLAAENLYFFPGRPRPDVLGRLFLGRVGARVTRSLAERFGADREQGLHTTSREAASLLRVRSMQRWTRDEREAWKRWSPLVTILPGVREWTDKERHDLVRIIRAKGGRRESDFVRRFDRHVRLRDAILELEQE